MGRVTNGVRVLGAGALSALASAFVAASIYAFFGYDIFSFTLWDWVPVGALACGCLAAIGLYVACILLNVRANRLLMVLAVLIGALAYVLAYAIQFWMLQDELPEGIGFLDYFRLIVTGEEVSVDVLRWSVGLGSIGGLGYLFAAFNFLAVSAGGWIVYEMIAHRPWCERCAQFKRTLGQRKHYFPNAEAYRFHRWQTDNLVPGSPEFLRHLATSHPRMPDASGVHYMDVSLLGCRKCGSQVLQENVQVHDGKSWSHLTDDERVVALPDGIDVSAEFPADAFQTAELEPARVR